MGAKIKIHSPLMRPWSRMTALGVTALALLAVFFFFTPGTPLTSLDSQTVSRQEYSSEGHTHSRDNGDISRVANESLGFSKIFVIGLPERSDKRDAMTLTSALTGFRVDFIDGVLGETIPDKAVPFGVTDRREFLETNLGSWRGHMNAIRRIVAEDLDSALIMEDDMDWDVRLKSQLEQVAAGARELFKSSAVTPRSPYGDDWDVMWLGHCGEVFPETLEENRNKPPQQLKDIQRKYTIMNDPTVPPPHVITGFQDFEKNPHTRWVHITGAPICSFAYALSQRGARKVLFSLSINGLVDAFDNELAGLCRRAVVTAAGGGGDEDQRVWKKGDRGLDAKCVTVTPPLFFHHKAKGPISGDSDIRVVDSNGIREKGVTENIMWSVRNNLQNIIIGTEMESQF